MPDSGLGFLASSSKLCRFAFSIRRRVDVLVDIENASSLEIPWHLHISRKTTSLEIPGRQHLSLHFGTLCRVRI